MLSLGVVLALFIIPHADVLATRLFWGGRTLQVIKLIAVNKSNLFLYIPDYCFHIKND